MAEKRSERCETCRFWEFVHDADENRGETGDCRRYAPRLLSIEVPTGVEFTTFPDEPYRRLFPYTDGNDWCGEWRPKGGN